MYQIFKNRIAAGGYQLADIQNRVKKLYAMGELTDEQLDELMALSQQNATAEAERPETLAMILNLAARVESLEKKLAAQDDTETEAQEYDEWVQPIAGLTDDYKYGAIKRHSGKLWRSIYKGQNVWEPGIPGTERMWEEYTPETEEG